RNLRSSSRSTTTGFPSNTPGCLARASLGSRNNPTPQTPASARDSLSVLLVVTVTAHSASVGVLELGGKVEGHPDEEQHVERQALTERYRLRGRVCSIGIVEVRVVAALRIDAAVLRLVSVEEAEGPHAEVDREPLQALDVVADADRDVHLPGDVVVGLGVDGLEARDVLRVDRSAKIGRASCRERVAIAAVDGSSHRREVEGVSGGRSRR